MKYIFLRRYKDYKIGQIVEIKNKKELEYLLVTETINKIENPEDGNFENYEIGNGPSDDNKTTETDEDDNSSSDNDKTTKTDEDDNSSSDNDKTTKTDETEDNSKVGKVSVKKAKTSEKKGKALGKGAKAQKDKK